MNDQKTYNEMVARLDAIAETIPEKQAERAATALRKAETYNGPSGTPCTLVCLITL